MVQAAFDVRFTQFVDFATTPQFIVIQFGLSGNGWMTVRGAKNLAENLQISEQGSAKPIQSLANLSLVGPFLLANSWGNLPAPHQDFQMGHHEHLAHVLLPH